MLASALAPYCRPALLTPGPLDIARLLLLAPLLEEWIMRAGVHHYLLQRYSPAAALCLSSVLFAALHGSAGWQQVALVFWPGLLFGIAYQRWRDWRLCALLHGLSNACAIAFCGS